MAIDRSSLRSFRGLFEIKSVSSEYISRFGAISNGYSQAIKDKGVLRDPFRMGCPAVRGGGSISQRCPGSSVSRLLSFPVSPRV